MMNLQNPMGNQPYELSEIEAKRRIEYFYSVNESAEKAAIEVKKRKDIKYDEIEADAKKAEKSSDLTARRALQKTTVLICKSGEIRLMRECFGDDLKDTAPFRVKEYARVSSYDESGEILYVSVVTIGGGEKRLFFNLSNLNEKQIQNAFRAAGLTFGFNRLSESSMREKLIAALLESAPQWKVPPHHGWYFTDSRWKFAFAETMTWKEMKMKCQRRA